MASEHLKYGYSELRFDVNIKYTLDEKCKKSKISLIILNVEMIIIRYARLRILLKLISTVILDFPAISSDCYNNLFLFTF